MRSEQIRQGCKRPDVSHDVSMYLEHSRGGGGSRATLWHRTSMIPFPLINFGPCDVSDRRISLSAKALAIAGLSVTLSGSEALSEIREQSGITQSSS